MTELPKGRLRLRHSGPLTPAEKRHGADALIVEVGGRPVCSLPYTAIGYEYLPDGTAPRLKITMIAGEGELTSRELNPQHERPR